MTEPTSGLSRIGFDRLIARALELEEAGNEQIDLERARAIAHELGIGDPAWEAALREQAAAARTAASRASRLRLRGRVVLLSLAGLVTGGLGGAFASHSGDGVLLLGSAAVAVGVALAGGGIRRRSTRGTQAGLAAWWLSVPAGIMVGMGEFHGDPMILAAAAWAGCAALGVALGRLRRRDTSPGSPAEAPAA
jgi:hypothetical protein